MQEGKTFRETFRSFDLCNEAYFSLFFYQWEIICSKARSNISEITYLPVKCYWQMMFIGKLASDVSLKEQIKKPIFLNICQETTFRKLKASFISKWDKLEREFNTIIQLYILLKVMWVIWYTAICNTLSSHIEKIFFFLAKLPVLHRYIS